MPSKAGTYTITYRVAPGLTGRAQAAEGRTSGSFTVRIVDSPSPPAWATTARVERGAGGPDS